jgi:hypothetical protein
VVSAFLAALVGWAFLAVCLVWLGLASLGLTSLAFFAAWCSGEWTNDTAATLQSRAAKARVLLFGMDGLLPHKKAVALAPTVKSKLEFRSSLYSQRKVLR